MLGGSAGRERPALPERHRQQQLIRQMLPYLIIKKPQAEIALRFQKKSIDPKFRYDKEAQAKWLRHMKKLNRRGVRTERSMS